MLNEAAIRDGVIEAIEPNDYVLLREKAEALKAKFKVDCYVISYNGSGFDRIPAMVVNVGKSTTKVVTANAMEHVFNGTDRKSHLHERGKHYRTAWLEFNTAKVEADIASEAQAAAIQKRGQDAMNAVAKFLKSKTACYSAGWFSGSEKDARLLERMAAMVKEVT